MPCLTRNNRDVYATFFLSRLYNMHSPLPQYESLYMIMGDLVKIIYEELCHAVRLYNQYQNVTPIINQELRSLASITVFGPFENPYIIEMSDIVSEASAIALYHRFSDACFSIFEIN